MNCTVTGLADLDLDDRMFIVENACKPNSDFQWKLIEKPLGEADGWIAVVRDQGEIVGWARTEKWLDKESGEEWHTLEAFTREEWRRRHVCQFAATGLRAAGRLPDHVAIFNPNLITTCRRMALKFTGYETQFSGWRKAY